MQSSMLTESGRLWLLALVNRCQAIVDRPWPIPATVHNMLADVPVELAPIERLIALGLLTGFVTQSDRRAQSIKRLWPAVPSPRQTGAPLVTTLRYNELVQAVDRLLPDRTRADHTFSIRNVHVARSLSFIDSQYAAQGVTLADAAALCRVSRCHLSRLIRKYTAQGFPQLLNERRVTAAAHLLNTTTLSVKEVAALVGYTQSTQLCSHFRRHFGRSPGSVRKPNVA